MFFHVVLFFVFSSCLDSKGAVKTPPHTDHCSTAQNILTHTHAGEVGKKTCLTSPDLTCKFSCRVYGVIKALLLVKSQRVHLERGATSKTHFSLNFPLFFLKSRDSKKRKKRKQTNVTLQKKKRKKKEKISYSG